MPKLKKENRQSGQHRRDRSHSSPFGSLLENAVSENCPAECYVVTYNADSQLQTYYYRVSREYTF